MFKIRIKQKSAPKLSKVHSSVPVKQLNPYRCLRQISDTQQHWKNLLKNQLEMSSTVIAFQNVEISMRVDAQKKLLLRETFMLKKQIIKLIVNERLDQIVQKIQLLGRTSPSDSNLAALFLWFYSIRSTILSHQLEYKSSTINKIKQFLTNPQKSSSISSSNPHNFSSPVPTPHRASSISPFFTSLTSATGTAPSALSTPAPCSINTQKQKQKTSLLYGRILYIAALHLVRLHGVLMKNQDFAIVVEALNAKKKQLCMIGNQINVSILQSLLFLSFEFYKILHLLKRDQDLIIQYYNQIQAYISIYRTKCPVFFPQFEQTFKITQKIQKMKPLNLNLQIYEDHNRRRVLSLQNTQQQLMKNHFALRNGNVLSTEITAQMNKSKAFLKRNNSIDSEHSKDNNHDNKDDHSEGLDDDDDSRHHDNNRNKLDDSKQINQIIKCHYDKFDDKFDQNMNKNALKWKKRIYFEFVKPCDGGMLKGKFEAVVDDQFKEFTVCIQLKRDEIVTGLFKLGPVLLQRKRSPADYAKKLWRVIKQKFYTDKTEFIPNLFSFDYPPVANIPNNIDTSYELPILVRIHEILLHYLRKQSPKISLLGQIIQFPASTDKKQLKQTQNLSQEKDNNKIFMKRVGFISFNKKIKNTKMQINTRHHIEHQQRSLHNCQESEGLISITLLVKEMDDVRMIDCLCDGISNTIKDVRVVSFSNNKLQPNLNTYKMDLNKHLGSIRSSNRKKKIKLLALNLHSHEHDIFAVQDSYNYNYNYSNTTSDNNNNMNRDNTIQQQFQVLRSPIVQSKQQKTTTYRHNTQYFVMHSQRAKKIALKNSTGSGVRVVVKLDNNYYMFNQKKEKMYTRYYESKREFILCKDNYDWQLVYRKYRIYKLVLFKNNNKNNSNNNCNQYAKVSCIHKPRHPHSQTNNTGANDSLQLQIHKQQLLDIQWLRTIIVRRHSSQYYFVNLFKYSNNNNNNEYENIIVSMYDFKYRKKYIGIIDKCDSHKIQLKVCQDNQLIVNGNIVYLKQFVNTRQHCISDQQQFINQQDSIKNSRQQR